MSALLLQPIVVLPEWEPVPAEPDAAIDYMAQWDYGEYSDDPETVETIYNHAGSTHRKGDYVMHGYHDGSRALFCVLDETRTA